MKSHRPADAVDEDAGEDGLELAAQRDPARFAALYDRYAGPVYRYLLSRVGSVADAQDLTTQVFMKALQGLAGCRPGAPFAAWLFTIARRTAVDFYRRRRIEQPLDWGAASPGADLLSQAIQGEEVQRLRHLLHALPPDDQELIYLRYAGGLSFAQIGAVLGVKEDTAKKTLYRLQDRLRSQMEDAQ